MSDSEWISVIAVVEFAGLVSIILLAILTRSWRGRRRDKGAVEGLVKRIRKQRDARRSELEAVLRETYGYEGEQLTQHAKRLMDVERHFYDQFITTYLNRDSEGVRQMDERLKAVVRPYVEMQHAAGASPAQKTAELEAEADEEETAAAEPAQGAAGAEGAEDRGRIDELVEDLRLYRQTLNRLFAEYTAMFGVHLDSAQQLTAREILGRLESGQLGGKEEATGADGNEAVPDGETDIDFSALEGEQQK